ncbi:MAG: hypothetical protein GC150_10145 [Rhizobiales bacterium]|nr:hypothetical protein [Hyphomicrobiales bacterium]
MTAQIADLHIAPVVRHETMAGASGRTYTVRVYRLRDLPAIEGGVFIALDGDGRALFVGLAEETCATHNLARIRYAAASLGATEVALLTPVRYARSARVRRSSAEASVRRDVPGTLRGQAGANRLAASRNWRLEGERLVATDLEAGCLGTIGASAPRLSPAAMAL